MSWYANENNAIQNQLLSRLKKDILLNCFLLSVRENIPMKKLLFILIYTITSYINCIDHAENSAVYTIQNNYDTLFNTHDNKEIQQDLLHSALFNNNLQSVYNLLNTCDASIIIDGPYPTLRFARTLYAAQLLYAKIGHEIVHRNTYFAQYHFFTLVKPHYDASLIPFFNHCGFSAHETDSFGHTPLTHLIAIAERYRGLEGSLIQKAHNLLDIHSSQQIMSLVNNKFFKELTTPPHSPLRELVITHVQNRLANTLSSDTAV